MKMRMQISSSSPEYDDIRSKGRTINQQYVEKCRICRQNVEILSCIIRFENKNVSGRSQIGSLICAIKLTLNVCNVGIILCTSLQLL